MCNYAKNLDRVVCADEPVTQTPKYEIHKFVVQNMFFEQKETIEELEFVKSCFFQRRQLIDGITDVKCPSHSTCLHLVINKDFTINTNPLTDEAKTFIKKN